MVPPPRPTRRRFLFPIDSIIGWPQGADDRSEAVTGQRGKAEGGSRKAEGKYANDDLCGKPSLNAAFPSLAEKSATFTQVYLKVGT